jgi:hypothetical protein
VAGDRRTRRLTEDSIAGQRTLDPAAPAPEATGETDPSEVLEPPPTQHSADQLEERQKRWFRLREKAVESADRTSATGPGPAENQAADPKG